MPTSDLLAELDLTAGDVSQSKTKIELPTGYLSMTEAPVMFYYSAQIHLRKLLNQIHQSLYNTKIEHLPDKIVSAFSVSLDDWKQNLPDSMQWQEGDEPSDDINTARLRAKYYGARYIIYRPVLERALHSKSPRVEGKGKEKTENDAKLSVSFKTHDFQAPSMTRSSSKREMRPNCREIDNPSDSIHYDELDDKTRRACDQCITAAIQSTKAFHNIKGRPIVTNIFGTAHA
ncbi:hypothetical protein EIK77_009227 [Talaromyces pinophilus]|nr:hypothetical protein EIK77_009227 [Talaromyces pinophilus]